jgi:hypothetical protein
MTKKESKGSKLGRMSKKITKFILIAALFYFAGRVLISVLFKI